MSKLKPFAKALVPAFLTLVATLAQSFINGKFDRTSATIAAVGLIGAAVTYLVPNAATEVQAAEAVFSPLAAEQEKASDDPAVSPDQWRQARYPATEAVAPAPAAPAPAPQASPPPTVPPQGGQAA